MGNTSDIKVVFFDAAGTLFHVRGTVADVYLQYAKKYGVQTSDHLKQAVNAAFKQAFQDAPPPVFRVDKPESLKQCERLWWFDIVHSVFYRVGMFEGFDEYFEDVYEVFSGEKHWELYPDTVPVLKRLKSEGFEIGIISNFDTRLFSVLGGLGIRALIDTVTISSQVQAAKPAKQIFDYALNQHFVDPEQAVHVGDSFHDDWQGASEANLKAVLICRNEENRDNVESIRGLTELFPLLSRR